MKIGVTQTVSKNPTYATQIKIMLPGKFITTKECEMGFFQMREINRKIVDITTFPHIAGTFTFLLLYQEEMGGEGAFYTQYSI